MADTMSLHRYAAKRDISERPIIDALEAAGATVFQLSKPADLLVGFRGINYLIECKTGKGKLTPDEKEFHYKWLGQVDIARTAEEALEIIGAI